MQEFVISEDMESTALMKTLEKLYVVNIVIEY